MITITVTTLIEADPKTVFDAFTDFGSMSRRIPGVLRVEVATVGPVCVGTRFTETRVGLGGDAIDEIEVISFELGRAFELTHTSRGIEYRLVYTFSTEGHCTRAELKLTARPLTLAAKLKWPLSRLLTGIVRWNLHGDLDSMRRSIEREVRGSV